jgi:multiple antibiotic resistance protein
MENFSFVFTVFLMLLGPIKLIPSFAGLMQGSEVQLKKAVAVRGAVIASVLCAFVALAGGTLLARYRISIDALRIAGGLVLLISSLLAIFQKYQPTTPDAGTRAAIQIAASPVAIPNIVPPAGIAVILLFMMAAPKIPGIAPAVAICLAIMMLLNLLVMYFIDQVMKIPGLMLVLKVLGSVLIFVQVGLAIEILLTAFKHLGVIPAV